MTKVSVVMTIYNTKEEYLREAIESILNQTFTDFEFIIVDDGSTEDHVKKTINSYKDERIKYFYKENEGNIAKARNFALDKCSGKYVAVMDSDDISLPQRFEKQVKYLDEHKDISLLGSWFEIFPKTEIVKTMTFCGLLDLLKNNQFGQSTIMFRKKIIEEYGVKYNEAYEVAEDYKLWTEFAKFTKLANIQDVLVKYRVHDNNVSKYKKEKMMFFSEKVKDELLSYLTPNNDLWRYLLVKRKFKLDEVFSIKNSSDKENKIITFLGIKILEFKRKNKKTIVWEKI